MYKLHKYQCSWFLQVIVADYYTLTPSLFLISSNLFAILRSLEILFKYAAEKKLFSNSSGDFLRSYKLSNKFHLPYIVL